jgi:cytochrome c
MHWRRLERASIGALLSLALAVACDSPAGDDDAAAGAAGTQAISGSAGALGAGMANGGNSGKASGGAGTGGATGGAGSPVAGSGGSSSGGAGSSSGGAGSSNAGAGGAATAGTAGSASAGTASQAGGGGAANAGAAGAGSGGSASGGGGMSGTGGGGPIALLVFSRTTGYRHESIPVALQALSMLAEEHDWTVTATEDPAVFNDAGLEPIDVIVFVMTLGDDILDDAQQAAFERFIRAGHGFVGIHSATDTEFEWPFYGELVGAYFREHPDVQPATLQVENREHPSTAHLMETWTRTDEWYSFRTNPREKVEVLLSLDESSYEPGASEMDGDHPIAWLREYEGGRSFQTALGHTEASYSEPAFLQHIVGGIEWASGR